MNTQELLDYDDLGEALREGRDLRPARAYRFLLAQDNLDFRLQTVPDPVPLGRQLLASAGLAPKDGYSLFAILPTGDFEDVRLDEIFDLRGKGTERFVAFQTDRLFKLTMNDAQVEWGKPIIGGGALYTLGKPGEDEAIFLEERGGEAREIARTDLIDLSQPGIERFITAAKGSVGYEIIVNARRNTVPKKKVSFEQVVQIAFPGSHEPNVTFSMTYRHAASEPHAGELGPGGVVGVKKKGTVFNVTRTVQS